MVEDNDSVRDVAAAMIEEMGFEVITAINGPDGLKTIEERRDINLVLSDVIMAGGMNGPEMAEKAMKMRPKLKVLFMSGYAPGSVRMMQDLPDSIELVNKPFTRNDLTEKVKRGACGLSGHVGLTLAAIVEYTSTTVRTIARTMAFRRTYHHPYQISISSSDLLTIYSYRVWRSEKRSCIVCGRTSPFKTWCEERRSHPRAWF